MSDGLFGFGGPGGGGGAFPGDGDGPDPMGYLDPSLRREAIQRWELRALQWRAAALAETCFDGRVTPRLLAGGGFGPLRGMLELEVPFASLEDHREAEARFLAEARRDEVLGPRAMVFVFRPAVGEAGGEGASAPADADEAA